MKVSENFTRELSYIKNSDIRAITAATLDAAPDVIVSIPASSSGKYHPAYSLGEGGLMRHVKAAVGMAHSLIETEIFANMIGDCAAKSDAARVSLMADCAYAALILHDCCKCDDTPKHSTRFDHPVVAAKLFKEMVANYIRSNSGISEIRVNVLKDAVPVIYGAIASHMGQFNTANYAKGVVLPKPNNGIEHFVHLCDYLASRKFLLFDFDVYAESDR